MRSRPGFVVPHLSAAFVPTDIAGCVLWLDASQTDTITESSGAVSQLNDLSGNGWHLTQGTGSLQPITGTRTVNGLNALDFDGSNDYMANTSFTGISGVNTTTVVAVIYNDGSGGNAGVVSLPNGLNDWGTSVGARFIAVTEARAAIYNGNVVGSSLSYGTGLMALAVRRNGANWSRWANGSSVDTGSSGTTNFAPDEIAIMRGKHAGVTDGCLNGAFCEAVVYSTSLSDADLGTVFDYLNAKWSVYA